MNTKIQKKIIDLTATDIQSLAKQAGEWISKNGHKDIEKVLDKATKATNKLSSDRLVDPLTLRMPLNL